MQGEREPLCDSPVSFGEEFVGEKRVSVVGEDLAGLDEHDSFLNHALRFVDTQRPPGHDA